MSAANTHRRVVLVHRYFLPDTPPYANMLRPIATALAKNGHEVTVLTCQPSYNRRVVSTAASRERVDGFAVVRWPVLDDRRSSSLKVLNLMWFCLRIIGARHYFRDADVVMASTTPPVLIAMLCGWLARRNGAKFIYHKQDIYPEVVQTPKSFVRRSLLSLLRQLDRQTDQRASRVVVLSRDMATTTTGRGSGQARTTVINNFDPWNLPAPGQAMTRPKPTKLTLVFAGNLGRFQGLEHVAALIDHTRHEPRIHWHFFGDGPLAATLKERATSGAAVVVHGYQPAGTVAEFVRDHADLGVISLNLGVISAAYPSKMMTYLRNGCPILALVEQDSELAQMVRSERIGLTGAQGDTAALAAQLRHLCDDSSGLVEARERAEATYSSRFSIERQLELWRQLVADVAAE